MADKENPVMTDPWASSRLHIAELTAQLHNSVARTCRGLQGHKPVQHRDRKPPWCHACGRTVDGRMVGTTPAPQTEDEA